MFIRSFSAVAKHITTNIGSNGVATVTISNPSRLNALTEDIGREFQSTVQSLAADHKLRAVVLTGAGKAFSAGGDLNFLENRTRISPLENMETMMAFYNRFLSIRKLPVPTIAAING